MDKLPFRGPILALFLGLVACGGGGDGESGTPPADAPPAEAPPAGGTPPGNPTPPPPDPAPPNRPPQADAGQDRSTVEEQDVVVDGSGTKDPEGDALTYRWRIVAAPAGSTVIVRADTPSFIFRPDLPGTYQLELTASDGRGESSDTMRVIAEPLLAFREDATLEVNARPNRRDERRVELDLATSEHYRGQPVAYTVTTDVPWLGVSRSEGTSPPPGKTTRVIAEIVEEEVAKLDDGEHLGRVIVTPTGGWEQTRATVTLRLRGSRKAVPYVAYTGKATRVTLYGKGLIEAAAGGISLEGIGIVPTLEANEERAMLELPPLPAGEHRLRLGTGDSGSASLRIVVRDEPLHVTMTTGFGLPGRPRSLQYDIERDVFYGVFVTDATSSGLRLRNSGTGDWAADSIEVDAPRAVALVPDGTELLIAAEDCSVYRLDPQTLAPLRPPAPPDCEALHEDFETMDTPGDGRVRITDGAASSVFVAPTGKAIFVFAPSSAGAADYRLTVRQLGFTTMR